MRASGFVACALALLSAACADAESRAPRASDGHRESDAPLTERSEASDDWIGDGDEHSVACGETSIALPIKRPTFYFVLDASESMLETMPASGGKNRYWAARTAIGDLLRRVGHRVQFGAALFPDVGNGNSCGAGSEVFAVRPGDRRPPGATADGPQLDALLFNLRKHTPAGATPVAATLRELLPSLRDLDSETHVFLLTDGAPNCNSNRGCAPERCIANIEGYRFTNGMSCSGSFNCCDPDLFPHLCLDDEDTIERLRALHDAGISVHVIGIPGSETYAEVLNAMARAAGTAQQDAETEYYRVDDVGELAETLTRLGDELSLECDFELEELPEMQSLVSVVADGMELVAGDGDGWDWTSERSITLLGDACTLWKSGEWDEITIFEGCDVRVR